MHTRRHSAAYTILALALAVLATPASAQQGSGATIKVDSGPHQGKYTFAAVKAGQSRKATASTTYEVDTRPDAILEPYQKAERAGKGMTGKASAKLLEKGSFAQLTFTGQTASGVKLEGSVDCRKVASEPLT